VSGVAIYSRLDVPYRSSRRRKRSHGDLNYASRQRYKRYDIQFFLGRGTGAVSPVALPGKHS